MKPLPENKKIVIFASGNGTNAENIIRHFLDKSIAKVVLVLSNNPNAKVLKRAKSLDVSAKSFTRQELLSSDGVVKTLLKINPDLIILSGFLWKFPDHILQKFPDKVINIHPALLPKYGGKGMYGSFVHKAVIAAKEQESGISIHYVNEEYDEGTIILQKTVTITSEDTSETLAKKIHELEYKWFPKVIEELLISQNI